MLPARPFVHHRNLRRLEQRHVTHNSQHVTSCPPAELTAFQTSAIFGQSGDEGAVRKFGRWERQL